MSFPPRVLCIIINRRIMGYLLMESVRRWRVDGELIPSQWLTMVPARSAACFTHSFRGGAEAG